MIKPKYKLENDLKRFMIRAHREIYGKGPKEAWVKINFNTATFYCFEPLTALEEFLLKTEGGEEEVKMIREKVDVRIKTHLCSEIECLTGIKVLDMVSKVCTSTNCIFGVIHFEENFE
ncbi:MAG: Na-translocating system protein MpsC family protein [Bacillota bacterium]|nr:Na-translocating system protein MpsC family protein [Bacillota bacterium]